MEKLIDIYKKTIPIVNYKIQEKEKFKKIELFTNEKKSGEIFLPFEFDKFLLILPSAGFNEGKFPYFFENFKFLLKNRISFGIYNLNVTLIKNDNEFFEYFKKIVGETRGIIDFSEKYLNIKEISILGVSFGGIIGFIVAASDERIKNCIFLISGVNFEAITWRSILRFKLKKDCSRIVCRKMHKVYRQLMKNRLYEEIFNFPRRCFLYDPLLYLENLKEKRILMINGLFDMIVPFYCAIEVKRKIKNARILWYPGTHLTFKFFFPFFKGEILKFLKDENLYRY